MEEAVVSMRVRPRGLQAGMRDGPDGAPGPGTGARRRPSREAPRAQGGDRARSRVSDVRRSGAIGDVSLYEEARRGHLWARGGPFWCRTETLRHPAPRVGPARGRVAHTNPSLTGSMSPTWCPGRGPHAGCFVTSPERPSAPAARALSQSGWAEGQQRQLRLVPTDSAAPADTPPPAPRGHVPLPPALVRTHGAPASSPLSPGTRG